MMKKINKDNFNSWKEYYWEYQYQLAKKYYIPFLKESNIKLKNIIHFKNVVKNADFSKVYSGYAVEPKVWRATGLVFLYSCVYQTHATTTTFGRITFFSMLFLILFYHTNPDANCTKFGNSNSIIVYFHHLET